MMSQRTKEWLDTPNIKYHDIQLTTPKRSTLAFCDYLDKLGLIKDGMVVLDLACGEGGVIIYMAKRYPNCQFIGVDLNHFLIERGNIFIAELGIKNVHLETGDIFNLDSKYIDSVDGVISTQTISWLPNFEESMEVIVNLNPDWIAVTSLFYDGLVSATTEMIEYNNNHVEKERRYYNVYSLLIVKEFLQNRGYEEFKAEPFMIDIDIERPEEHGAGTYTQKLANGDRLQISACLYLPWYFVSAIRKI